MKKFLFLAALVGVAFTSCVKNEEFAPKTQKEISFEVANYVQSTRVAFDTNETFGAYVWHNSGSGLTLMNSGVNSGVATVSHSAPNWVPTPTLYWPTTGSVDCQAFYPTTLVPTMDATGTTLTYPTYTVLNAAEDATAVPAHDVKYANRAHRYTANESYEGFTGIPTLFNHALAKLNFKVALEDTEALADVVWTAQVTNITVEGVYDTGKLVLETTVPTGTTAAQSTWTLPSPAIWTKVGDTTADARNWAQTVALAEGDVKTFDATETYYVLPQAINNVQKGTITYSLTQSVGGVSTTTTHTKPFNFYGKGLDNWEMNKNITYTLTITPHTNKILFAPAVTDWTDDNSGSILVQ